MRSGDQAVGYDGSIKVRKQLKIPDEIGVKADRLAAKRGLAFNALVIDLLIKEIGDERLRKYVRTVGWVKGRSRKISTASD